MTGWKLTLPCTRDEAEAIGELDVETLGLDPPPTLMTREPDESRPDEWLLEAYFEGKPDAVAVARIGALSALGAPHNLEPLGDEDWVTMSQAGLKPVIASSSKPRTTPPSRRRAARLHHRCRPRIRHWAS